MGVLDRWFAATYDRATARLEAAGLARMRRELLEGAHGHVVEIGAGTGANLAELVGRAGRVTACEPVPEMARRLRDERDRLAPARPGVVVEVIEAPAEALPLPDASVDAAVSTLVLCTVREPDRALAEIRRVLRPEGRLLVIEHVAGAGGLRRVQSLLEPVWKVAARGCHLTRDTRALIAAAGFDVSELRPWRLPSGGPAAPAIVGPARPSRER